MPQQTVRETPGALRAIPVVPVVLLVAFALAAVLSLRGNRPPEPLGSGAPADAFSAVRAREVLSRVLGDGRPHPTGSAANAAVRDRIVAEFDRLGLAAVVQRRFACGPSTCATVDNIVARLPGTRPAAADGRGVLLSAHYDSVAAGPGASDDGAGVAALLEVARALQASAPLPHDIWLLANDGEELGLVGAEAFVREPEFAGIATVVNLEARGTTGASLLIETQPGNASVIAAAGRALPRPGGTSLDYEIYKTLPNDTDFTVYRREGLAGVNFAWARGAARYHTPLDDLAHLDPGSLQQHGDNMLAMARAFGTAGTDLEARHDAVFFGLFGLAMVSWPATWNLALLVLGLAAWALLAARRIRAKAARPWALVGAGVTLLLLLVVFALAGWALHALLGALGATPAPWTAQQGALVGAFVLLAAGLATLLARPLARWFGEDTLGIAGLLPFALVAVLAVLGMPGASHVGLVPLVAGALAGHLWPRRPALWSGVAAIAAVVLWFPYVADSYSAIGHPGLPPALVLMGLVLLPLLPALAGLGRAAPFLGGGALAGAFACAVLASTLPAFDADVPRSINLVHVGTGNAPRLFANTGAPLPDALADAGGFETTAVTMVPWSDRTRVPGPPGPTLPSPEVEIVQDRVVAGQRHVAIRLRSARGAGEGVLYLPESIEPGSVRVQGEALAVSRHPRSGPWRAVTIVGLPAGGALVEFRAPPDQSIELYGVDVSHGVPAALAAVVRARDRVAVPIHGGDVSLAWTRLEVPAQGSSNRSTSAR